jgi:hypothetical protein
LLISRSFSLNSFSLIFIESCCFLILL